MKNEHIKQLINRYMQGQTTLDEERELAQWFRSHNVDDDWKPYQQMFAWFDEGMPQQEGLLQEPHSPNASEIPTRRLLTVSQRKSHFASSMLAESCGLQLPPPQLPPWFGWFGPHNRHRRRP